MDKAEETLELLERRNFLKLTGMGAFTAAMVAGAAGTLWSAEAAAQTAAEERKREDEAEYTMTIATAYVLGASRSYPIMQLDLKENIQNATGRQDLRQARAGRPARRGRRAGAEGAGRHHPGGPALAVELRAVRAAWST